MCIQKSRVMPALTRSMTWIKTAEKYSSWQIRDNAISFGDSALFVLLRFQDID